MPRTNVWRDSRTLPAANAPARRDVSQGVRRRGYGVAGSKKLEEIDDKGVGRRERPGAPFRRAASPTLRRQPE
jgi:hypothetical protein